MKKFSAPYKVLFLLLVLLFTNFFVALAQVTIIKPTNGQYISNDKSTLGPSAAYTALGDIVIADQAAGDFATGSNITLTFAISNSTWQFEAGVGTVSFVGSTNITAAAIVVTSSTITVTYTVVGATATDNSLTISGINVQSNSNTLAGGGDILRGGTGVINGFPNGAVVATLSKTPGSPSSLQVLLPGQTNVPGTTTGKTGTAVSQTAGVNFSVAVNLVDYAFNICTNASPQNIELTTANPYPNIPSPLNSTSGTAVFEVMLKAARPNTTTSYTFTAHNLTDGNVAPNTSSNLAVLAGNYVKLLMVMPGEDYVPGSSTGKTGTSIPWVSNKDNIVTVYAVDGYWNKVTTVANTIVISATDTDATLPNGNTLSSGSRVFTVRLRTIAVTNTITAKDQTTGFELTSAAINVVPGPYTKLQILLPGETNAPNTTSGKIGTPFNGIPPIAGTPFNVIVNAVDANWNLVTTISNSVSISNNNSAYTLASVLPAAAVLVSGTKTFVVTLKRAISQTLRASDADPSKTSALSSSILIGAGTFVKLQLLLPGESADPGTDLGKKGASLTRFSGVAFSSSVVNAVDEYWNKVLGVNDQLQLSTSTSGATVPSSLALVNGTRKNFSINLRVLGATTVTATNTTNGSILGSSANVMVESAGFAKLQILLPGEIAAPSTISGKVIGATPIAQTAGISFTVTVNAVDAGWNLINTITDEVKLTATDINATMPPQTPLSAGTATFNVNLITAGSKTIKASDASNGSKSANTSAYVVVNPRPYFQLLALLPNQFHAPGTVNGIGGNPSIPARGVPFDIQIRAVDEYFNPVNGITNELTFASSDGTSVLPAATNLLSSSFRVSSFTISNPGAQTVTITDATAGKTVVVTIPIPTPASLVTNYFRSVVSGSWANAAIWESSVDNITWYASTLVPVSTANKITIQSPHVVEILATIKADQITIDEGAELLVSGGTFTVEDGPEAIDMQVNGKLTGMNTGEIISTGVIAIANRATYQHRYTTTGGTIPTAVWATGSRCELISYTSWVGNIEGSDQHFADFLWDCQDQNILDKGPSFLANFQTRGLTVSNTGAGTVNLNSAIINGNFELINGNVALVSSAAINITGDLKLLDGTLSKGAGAAAATVNFSGSTAAQQFINAGVIISGTINFGVNSNAKVDFGSNEIDGTSGSFTLAPGATIITANPDGLAAQGGYSGTIQNAGSRIFSTSANYIYNGNVQQTAGNGLPQTVNDLTIDNALGVRMPPGAAIYNVNGALSITGFLDMNEHPLLGTFTLSGLGTLMSGATNAFDSHKNWNLNVEYNSATAQNIIAGNYLKSFKTSNAGVKVGPVGALNVAGNWSSNGGEVDFHINNTTLNFNGTTPQSITDGGSNGGLGLQFYKVNFSNAGFKRLVDGKFNLATTGILTMEAGTRLDANANLTLMSGAMGSATVAEVPVSAEILGGVAVERFIQGGAPDPYRTYRMLSSPIYDNTSGNRSYNFNQFIKYTPVSGNGGASNGFDVSPGTRPASAWYYNNGYVELPHINTSIAVGKGAYIFFRGDRTEMTNKIKSAAPFAEPEDVKMVFSGVLNQQNVVVPLTYDANVTGFNLLGNPYASSIDWNNTSKTDLIDNSISIYNPSFRQYATYLNGASANGGSNVINAGQGFFVKAKPGGGSFTFKESDKIASAAPTLLLSHPLGNELTLNGNGKLAFANAIAATQRTKFSAWLKKEVTPYKVETVVVFEDGNSADYIVGEDAIYSKGSEVFMSSVSKNNTDLVINFMPSITLQTEVPLNIHSNNTSGNYLLELTYSNLPQGYLVKLNDKFLGSSAAVENGSTYSFAIDKSVQASFGANRFSFSFDAPTTLPVTFTSFVATKVNEGVVISWKSESENNNNRYELERAGENQVYLKLYTVRAKGSGSTYSFLDKSPLLGNNYYRLVEVVADNKTTTTAPIVINYNGVVNQEKLSVFPNPVKEQFNLKFNGSLREAQQTVKITNASGEVLLTKSITASALAAGDIINIANYPTGLYMIEIFENGNQKIGQTKLIKQ